MQRKSLENKTRIFLGKKVLGKKYFLGWGEAEGREGHVFICSTNRLKTNCFSS